MQVLHNGVGQTRGHRGVKAQGGNGHGGRDHHPVQAGEPHRLCLGDTRSSAGRRRLHAGEHPERQLNQQVMTSAERADDRF